MKAPKKGSVIEPQETLSTSFSKPSSAPSTVMLFDLEHTGHHATYIRYLIQYWGENKLTGNLSIVVSPTFIEKYPDVVELAKCYADSTINIISISQEETQVLIKNRTAVSRALRRIKEWRLLCRYALSLKASRCIILYLDTFELPFLLGLKAPCSISGIYFRPTFHYLQFQNYRPSRRDRVGHWREKFFVKKVLTHPQFETLFCLDPIVSKTIKQQYPNANAVPIADPVEMPDVKHLDPDSLRRKHGISTERTIVLLFGAITSRKGTYKLLEAIKKMSPEDCERLCILIVGAINDAEKQNLVSQIETLCRQQPVQIVTQFEFVSETDVQTYFQLADVVSALYQHHAGMSGILLLAAAAGKPVLSSDYGLMGELARRYQLGVILDSTCVDQIARELSQHVLTKQIDYSPEKMRLFAEENSAIRFAQTVFQQVERQVSTKVH